MSSPVQGYVYVPDENAGVLPGARAGARVSLPARRPPWIVVDHSVESVTVARWPGRLWRAAVVDAAGIEQPSAPARYTRAFAIDVVEEIPAARLFGGHGGAVVAVIAAAARLELAQVCSLAKARHPDAEEAYSRAWSHWLAAAGETPPGPDEKLGGTLAMFAGGSRSPIHCGFTVVYNTMANRAEQLVGPSAFVVNDEGERYLEPTWASACDAMLEAAMAFGAPTLSSENDRDILKAAWRRVIGSDPPLD